MKSRSGENDLDQANTHWGQEICKWAYDQTLTKINIKLCLYNYQYVLRYCLTN